MTLRKNKKFKDKNLKPFDKIKNMVIGLFWILFSIILLISILSYDENDNSFNSISTNENINNYLGSFGSHLADLSIQFFGLSSFLFVGIFFILGFKTIFNKKVYNKYQKIIAFFCVIFSSSVFFNTMIFSRYCISGDCGGVFGSFFANFLYYNIPDYLLIMISFLIFFISISYLLDIKRKWWIVKFAKTSRFIKAFTIYVGRSLRFLFILFTTKSFRRSIKMFFIGKKEDYIFVDEDEVIENVKVRNIYNEEKEMEGEMEEEGSVLDNEDNEEDLYSQKIDDSLIKTDKYIDNYNDFENDDRQEDNTKSFFKGNKNSNNKKSNKYILPSTSLVRKNPSKQKLSVSRDELLEQSKKLIGVLKDFGIKGEMLGVRAGPIITLHEFEPSAGTKSSRVIGLSDDIARSMSAVSTRISVVPGKNAMGIELPNDERETIYIKDILESNEYKKNKGLLPIIIGSDIGGGAIIADLAKMPHLLVAGTTGSGKSVAINTMITSLLYRMTPDQCKFIMIDPKMLELSVYEGIPHLLTPVVTEPLKAIIALKWVCREMEDRYRIMASLGVRNIAAYNEKLEEAMRNGDKLTRRVQVGFDSETDEPIYEQKEIEEKQMPFIVVIVDEMADLMITAGKEIEASIQRIAQKARAAGIHIIMATQRPSVDVITGVIKANFPTRMSFQVVSKIDSRTILGEQGAEQLLGMGDMLYMAGGGKIIRAHGPFVSDGEVEKIVSFIKSQGIEPEYVEEVIKNEDEFSNDTSNNYDAQDFNKEKDLYKQAIMIIKRDKKSSISYIQRQLRIGYNKAANIIEELERRGVLSSPNNTGKREILIDEE